MLAQLRARLMLPPPPSAPAAALPLPSSSSSSSSSSHQPASTHPNASYHPPTQRPGGSSHGHSTEAPVAPQGPADGGPTEEEELWSLCRSIEALQARLDDPVGPGMTLTQRGQARRELAKLRAQHNRLRTTLDHQQQQQLVPPSSYR